MRERRPTVSLVPLDHLDDLLSQARREHLFGKITFEFNDGDVKLVRKEATYKVSYPIEEDHSNVYAINSQLR
jgi:hypothetical protein